MILSLLLLRALGPLSSGTLAVDAGDSGPVEIVWDGCETERAGPVCVTGKGERLVVWVRPKQPVACERLALALTGRGHRTRETGAVDGGCWTRVEVEDPSKGALELRTDDGRVVWSMRFEPQPPRHRVVDAAVARVNGDPAGARRYLEAEIPRIELENDELALADALLTHAKLAFLTGDFAAGATSAKRARALYTAEDWPGTACAISALVAQRGWKLHQDREAVTASLRELFPCVAAFPRFALTYRNVQAQILRGTPGGDPHAVWAAYRDLDVLARRVQDVEFEVVFLSIQNDLAQQLQLREEVARIDGRMAELQASGAGDGLCGMAIALNNNAWTTLLRRERGEEIADLRPRLARLRAVFSAGACADPRHFRHATLHLALASLHKGDHAAAEALLVHTEDRPEDPEGTLWRHRILARAGLDGGNLKLAAAHTDALTELARDFGDPFFAWHAAYARGVLAEARGHLDAAIAEYAAAEALREEMALPLALGAARERLGVDWDDGLRRLVGLLLARGDHVAALRAVRLARRRALRGVLALARLAGEPRVRLAAEVTRHRDAAELAARADRRLPVAARDRARVERRRERLALRRRLDEAVGAGLASTPWLRECAAGELLLVFYPFGDRWLAFADDGSAVAVADVHITPDMTDERLGDALYEPFADAIVGAREIRILAADTLGDRDLHGLPFRGRPLFAHAPVVYALDLDDTVLGDLLAMPRPFTRGVVVAADPGGEARRLPAVSREAVDVEQSWHELGLSTRRLHGDRSTRPALLEAVAAADILHFAGHNLTPPEAAGSDLTWDRELLLEQDSSLAVEDVLLAPAAGVPRIVVLSACETGKADPRAASGGVGIGQAFLTRGADLVVATSRLVDDGSAARVSGAFYAEAPDIAALADPTTLAAAQVELLGEASCAENRDICAYRAWVR